MEILIKIKNYPKSALLRVYEKGFSSFSRKIISMMPGFSPQVILMMDGGLGSQMMKYAVGREVERISGLPVSFDLSWFDKSSRDCNGIYNRTYRIDRIFPKINVKKATTRDIILYKLHFRYPFPSEGIEWEYNEVMMSSRQARYLGGYYINAQYVDKQGDRLRDEFSIWSLFI